MVNFRNNKLRFIEKFPYQFVIIIIIIIILFV